MAPILGIYASQISGHLFAPSGAYDSIATTTVGAGGSSSISFTSIPSTYTHLQVRGIGRTDRADYNIDDCFIRFNSDTGSNYASHRLNGDFFPGTVARAAAYTSQTGVTNGLLMAGASAPASVFGAGVFDILDYANTNKYKTYRALTGTDTNGAVAGINGFVALTSGLWQSTNAITSISITPGAGTIFTQYSTFALYGIKGA